MGDGLGVATFFMALCDNPDIKNMPTLKTMSIPQKIVLSILYPFLLLKTSLQLLLKPSKVNCINKAEESGIKKAAVTQNLDL